MKKLFLFLAVLSLISVACAYNNDTILIGSGIGNVGDDILCH
ncbi:hypothetical protein [Methanothermococcus sp.]|nr:hypothetical protein [Methanothermococcus sp.]